MNVLKKVVATVAACATLGAMAVSASAYTTNYFYFSVPYEDCKWAGSVVKEDGFDSPAAVHATSGNVTARTPIFVTIYNKKQRNNAYRVSSTNMLESNDDNVQVNYTDANLVYKGGAYYLLGETGAYTSTANGKWNP